MTTLTDICAWLEEIVTDKGLDPKQVIDFDDDDMFSFQLTLNDGTIGRAFILDTGDGYFSFGCANAVTSLVRFSELVWFKVTSAVDLMASIQSSKGDYYGMASIRTKPQSAEELRQELSSFVTRLGLAVDSFRKAASATPTGTSRG